MGNYINSPQLNTEVPERADKTNPALKGFTLNLPKGAVANIKLFIKWGWYTSRSEFGRKAIMDLIEKNMEFFDKSGALKTAVIRSFFGDKIIKIPGRKTLYVRRVLE